MISPLPVNQCEFFVAHSVDHMVPYMLTFEAIDASAPCLKTPADVFNAIVTDHLRDQYRWTMTITSIISRTAYRVAIRDLLEVHPDLSLQASGSHVAIMIAGMGTVPNYPPTQTLEPWIQNKVWPMASYERLVSEIELICPNKANAILQKILQVHRPAAGYESVPERRLDVQIVRDLLPQERMRPNRVSVERFATLLGSRESRGEQVELARTLFRSLVFGPRFLTALKPGCADLLSYVTPTAMATTLIFLLAEENQHRTVFPLDEAQWITEAATWIAPGALDLASYRYTASLNQSETHELTDEEQFRVRLDQFMCQDPEISLFRSLQNEAWFWNVTAVTGSAMTWALPKFSSRVNLSKDEEMRLLYADADLDLPCRIKDLPEFLAHVARATDHFDSVLGAPGTLSIARSAKVYTLTDDDAPHEAIPPALVERCLNDYLQICQQFGTQVKLTDLERAFYLIPADQIKIESHSIATEEFDRIYSKAPRSVFLNTADPMSPPRIVSMFADGDRYQHPQIGMTIASIRVQIVNNAKVTYSHPKLLRPLQFYMINEEIGRHVARFHLECVRAYYDGNQVYLTASAAIAFATHTVHSPWGDQTGQHAQIVNKYANRGYQVQYFDDQVDHGNLSAKSDRHDLVRYQLAIPQMI